MNLLNKKFVFNKKISIFRLDGLDKLREVSFFGASHLQDLLKLLNACTFHQHFVPFYELFVVQSHQFDDIFSFRKGLVNERIVSLQFLWI
jgi:hypothetical protein